MIFYRLSLRQYARSLDGIGASLAGGRWNHKGVPMVYASEYRSLAVLELLVHLSPSQFHAEYVFVGFELSARAKMEELSVNELPTDWRDASARTQIADLGTRWVQSGGSLGLRVPSVIVSQDWNVLLNPAHPDFVAMKVSKPEPFSFDKRLWRRK